MTGSSGNGPWLVGSDTASFEWLTYVPDGVTWTTNTGITFPVFCDVTNGDPSTPTVVYVGVADL